MALKEQQNDSDERRIALRGRHLVEFEARRAAASKQRSESPKMAGQVLVTLAQQFTTPTAPGYFSEGPMLKARCKRLAGRSTVVNNTVFTFDKDGISRVVDQGNARLDYDVLLRQNGVERLDDDENVIPRPHVSLQPEPKPAPVFELPLQNEEAQVEPDLSEEHAEMEAAPPDLVMPPSAEEKPIEKSESRRKPAKSK